MFFFGLTTMVCYIPGITGASIPTQWALFSAVLPFFLWHAPAPPLLDPFRWFIGWAIIGLAWSVSPADGFYDIWIACCWFLCFWLGLISTDLRPLWRGLAIGLVVSSVVAIAQTFGHSPVITFDDRPVGLLYNPVMLGAATAVILTALVAHRLWFYIPGILPALWLSNSRGAFGVVALVLIARRVHWTITTALLLAAATYFVAHIAPTTSDEDRLNIWVMAGRNLTLFGYGAGSFNALYFAAHDRLFHPQFVHNDALQLWFTYGPFALVPITLILGALSRPSPDRWPLLAVTILSLFWFPLFAPITSLAAFACAGHLLRDYDLACHLRDLGRHRFLSWLTHTRRFVDPIRRRSLPARS